MSLQKSTETIFPAAPDESKAAGEAPAAGALKPQKFTCPRAQEARSIQGFSQLRSLSFVRASFRCKYRCTQRVYHLPCEPSSWLSSFLSGKWNGKKQAAWAFFAMLIALLR
jgi:hypothetical protein